MDRGEMRRGIREWVAGTSRAAGRGVRRITPATVAAGLTAAALAPVALAALSTGVLPTAALLGLTGGMGGNFLADVLVKRFRLLGDGPSLTPEQVREELADELRQRWEAGGAEAAAVREAIAELLASVGGIEEALTAAVTAVDGARDELVTVIVSLTTEYGEFRGFAAGMAQALSTISFQLAEHSSQQRHQAELTRDTLIGIQALRRELGLRARRTPLALPAPDDPEPIGPLLDVDPYPGLAAFQAEDAEWFFGRERLTATLVTRLTERLHGVPVLAVVGPSGAGKSSVLRAGLRPALVRGDAPVRGSSSWPVVVLNPGGHPLTEVAVHLGQLAGLSAGAVRDELRAEPERLALVVRQALAATRSADADEHRLVIVVDQFEEVFTQSGADERRLFLRALRAVADIADGVRAAPALLVLGIRADFLGQCVSEPDLIPLLQDNQVLVGPLADEELVAAVEQPARRAGVRVEPGLTKVILRELRERARGKARESGEPYDPGALPLLAHALRETWLRRQADAMTLEAYWQVDGLHGSVAATAERFYASLDENGVRLLRRMLLRLVTVGQGTEDTRNRVPRAALVGRTEAADAILDGLIAARLVTAEADTVEITHEALLWAWPRLRDWLTDDRAWLSVRREITTAVQVWRDHGDDPGALYSGNRLAIAREWVYDRGRGHDLDDGEREFVALSVGRDDAERAAVRRRERLRKQAIAVLAALLAVAVGAGVVAYDQRQSAVAQRLVAERQAGEALSRQVAIRSDAIRSQQPRESLLLAAAAWRLAPTAEARGSILTAQRQPYAGTLTRAHDVTALAFAPAGGLLATADAAGAVRVWDPVAGTNRQIGDHQAIAVAFHPDGRRMATGGGDRTVRLWTVGGQPGPVLAHPQAVDAVAFSPDGRLLATTAGRAVRLWNAGTGAVTATLTGHDLAVNDLAFGPDSRTLVSASVDGTVQVWDIARRTATAVLRPELPLSVEAVAITGQGGRIVAAAGILGVHIWDVRSPAAPIWKTGPLRAPPTAVDISPDGRTMAVAGNDRVVELWDLTTREQLPTVEGHSGQVSAVAFSPDGGLLATAGQDHALHLWDMARVAGPGRTAESAVLALDTIPDGRVVTGDQGGAVRIWAAGARVPTAVHTEHTRAVTGLAVTADGGTAISGGGDGIVYAWPLAGSVADHVLAVGQPVSALAPYGSDAVAIGDTSGTVEMIGVSGGPPRAAFEAHDGSVTALAVSADGGRIATAGSDGQLRLWDARTHASLGRLTGLAGTVAAVAFSPDGRHVAAAGDARAVHVWRVADLTPVATLTGHIDAVLALAYAPDGRTLASGGQDGTVRLWDAGGHDAVAAVRTGAPVPSLAFTPDGSALVTADPNPIRWTLDPAAVHAALCARAHGDELTDEEWRRYIGATPAHRACP